MSLLTAAPAVDAPVAPALPVLPRVNLLPPEIAERARLQRLQAGLGAGVLVVAGAVTALYLGAAGSVTAAQQELDIATAAGADLRTESAQFSDVLDVYARAEHARGLLTAAMGQEVRYSQFLDGLSRSVPDDVWLKTVEFSQAGAGDATGEGAAAGAAIGTVTFSGVAFRHDDVAAWLEALGRQEGYADPTFTDATAGEIGQRPVVTFTSTVSLTSAALSQRWTTGTGG